MFNSMSTLPYVPYNIMVYLATATTESAEMLWKMMKYNDYDALSKPNLTFDEKMAMVWKTGRQDKFHIFLTNLVEDAIAESSCIMKCYDYYIHAKKLYEGTVVYAFDFLYGTPMSLVEYNDIPVSRGDLFIHCILDNLNGANVGGVGTLTFLDDMSRYNAAKSVVGNQKTFSGVCLYMATNVGDVGRKEDCGN